MISSRLAALPHQLGFLAKTCCSAPRSLGRYGPLTTVGLSSSGLPVASSHDFPSQTCLGTGPMEPAMLSASNRASVSFSVTVTDLPSALKDSMRLITVPNPTQLFSRLLAISQANWKSSAVIGLPS